MKREDICYGVLLTHCCGDHLSGVKFVLKTFGDSIGDILRNDAKLFKIALSKDNPEICKALIDFFESRNPSEKEKEKLREILEEEVEFMEIAPEVRLALKDYLPYDEGDRLNDFTEQENADFMHWMQEINTPQLAQGQESQEKNQSNRPLSGESETHHVVDAC